MSQEMVTDPIHAIRELNPALDPDARTASDALSLLVLRPETEAYLTISSSDPAPDPTAEPFPYLIPGTRIFVDTAVAWDLRADVLTALAVWAASGSASLSTATALLRKLVTAVKMLDDDSRDLVVVVAVISVRRGGRPATWDDVVAAYDGRTGGIADRLDRLVRRGVLAHHPDGWTVTP